MEDANEYHKGKAPEVRVTSRGGKGDERSVTLSGLSEDEEDLLVGMSRGFYWTRVVEGRVVASEAHKRPPQPPEDERISPLWQPAGAKTHCVQRELLNRADAGGMFGAHFIIQSLCGYDYTPSNYAEQAAKLESYGFECLRSRRGRDGGYWEIWFLPGLWAAKGDLAEFVADVKDDPAKVKKAVSFLCRHASFGTLDVSVQRAAMVMDD